MTLTSIELFSGAGGMALGLHQAGFHHRLLVECDRHSCATLRGNKERLGVTDGQIVEKDIAKVDFGDFEGEIDLLAAGVPCQPFSLAGKHRGHADDRNLFPQLFRAVRAIRPKVVLVENVQGLARPGFKPYFDYIVRELEMPEAPRMDGEGWEEHDRRLRRNRDAILGEGGLTYAVTPMRLDCADYGVPQRRRRVFFVARRRDLRLDWSGPTATHTEQALVNAKWVSGTYWKDHGLTPPRRPPARLTSAVQAAQGTLFTTARWRTVRDAIGSLPKAVNGKEHPSLRNHVGNPGARAYPGHTGSPWDEPAKTLKAGDHGVPGGENMLRNNNGTVRYFTVREAACLQTFPMDYAFMGAWTECLRQLGNAVPVEMARTLAAGIREALGERGSSELRKPAIAG